MTTFPSLDIPTLFVVSAAVVGSSGLLLILARGRDQGSRPQLVWGAAMVVGAVGIILLAMAPRVDWPARILGNVAILVGTGLSWSGARIFGGRRPNLLALAAGPAAWLLLDGLGWGRDHPAPTILSFLAGAAYTLGAAYELWRSPEERRTTRNAAVLLLLLHATLYVLQAAATAVAPARFLSDDLIVLLMLEALLHTTWMAFLFLALIKERAELHANQELRTLATYDQLTGLGNRRHFDQTLRQEFRRAARGQTPLGLLMIDVDHFKSFNDTYGHPEGDESLRSVAGAIQAACSRAGDQAMRYGGEEFAVLLPRIDEIGALAVAEAICRTVRQHSIRHAGGKNGIVTVSIGAACITPHPNMPVGQLLRAADQALYAAKSAGRDKAVGASTLTAPVATSTSSAKPRQDVARG